jgi:predicted component of type VI protein secretion system
MSARLTLEFKVTDGSTRSVLVDATEPVLLGRSSECAVVLDDRSVSARHAEIRVLDGRPQVRDAASRWGTFVDRIRIEGWSDVPDGSDVWLGGLALSIRVAEAPGSPPPEAVPSETRTMAGEMMAPPVRGSSIAEEDDSLASVIVRQPPPSPPDGSEERQATPATSPPDQESPASSGSRPTTSAAARECTMTHLLLLTLGAGGVIAGAILIWFGR